MQIALAIETMLDLNMLSVKELVGCLRSAEERYLTNDQGGGRGAELLMMEAQWHARKNQRAQGQNSGQGGGQGESGGPGGSGGQGGGSNRRRSKQQNRRGSGQGGGGNGGRDGAPNEERDMSQVKCYNCNKPRHFSKLWVLITW
nr:glycine-rich cell wall structural protein 2-like [Aegilops tauschii subsp. strangulata]